MTVPLPPGWVEIRGRHLPGFALEPALQMAKQHGGYWFLGSPYSRFAGGLEAAAVAACRGRAWLLRQGLPCFSPIAHSHWIALYGGLDPLAHDIWLPAEAPLRRRALGMILLGLDGWRDSKGLAAEIDEFGGAGKPIWFLPPEAAGITDPKEIPA